MKKYLKLKDAIERFVSGLHVGVISYLVMLDVVSCIHIFLVDAVFFTFLLIFIRIGFYNVLDIYN
jgi:hypothetical protein